MKFEALSPGDGSGSDALRAQSAITAIVWVRYKSASFSLLSGNYKRESSMGGRLKTPAKDIDALRLNLAELSKAWHMGKAEHLAWELSEKWLLLKVAFVREARQEERKVSQASLLTKPGKPC